MYSSTLSKTKNLLSGLRQCGEIASALLAVMSGLFFSSCQSKTAKWEKTFATQVNRAIADGTVTESEYKVLQQYFLSAPDNAVFDGCPVDKGNDGQLPDILVAKGIKGDAAAIVSRIHNAPFSVLNIMFENSASMMGYAAAGNPFFTAPIIALFNGVENDTEIVTGYVHARQSDGLCEYQIENTQKFQNDLTNGRLQMATSSPLDQIFGLVADTANDSTVTALVTDGIVSGTNSEILGTVPAKDWTVKNLPLIEQRVRNAAKRISDKGGNFMLCRFETAFNGVYYDYKNYRHQFSSTFRPFFIILFGTEKNLRSMYSKLEKENGFKATDVMCSYEYDDIPAATTGIVSYVPVPGVAKPKVDVTPAKATVKFKKPVSLPFAFKCRVVLDKNVPEAYRTADFIKDNACLKYNDALSGTYVDKTEMIYDVQPVNDTPNVMDIFIQVPPDFVNGISGQRILNLNVPLAIDGWCDALSDSDDTVIDGGNRKTFHLDVLAQGLIKGFGMDEKKKSLIDINISLLK